MFEFADLMDMRMKKCTILVIKLTLKLTIVSRYDCSIFYLDCIYEYA